MEPALRERLRYPPNPETIQSTLNAFMVVLALCVYDEKLVLEL